MSNWKIFKKIITKKVDQITAEKRDTIDKNLPLGFRLGGLVSIDQSDFILNRGNLQFESPGKEHVVKAWGTYDVHGIQFHRFYLMGKENEEESVIETASIDGKVEEIKLLRNFDEIFPDNNDEWEWWLKEAIGDTIFETVDNEGEENEVVTTYHRQWDDSTERVNPTHFKETIYLDRYGDNVESMEVSGMLYGRPTDEEENTTEFLMIGCEETDEEASVRMLIGINIGEADIKVV